MRSEVREALESKSVDSVAVVARDDAVVLRMALIVRSISEEAPLVLTIFDETMAEQVAGELPNTHVTSLADIVAPSLAGPCIDERATALSVDGDEPVLLVEDGDELEEEPVPQLKAHRLEALARRAVYALRQERRPPALRRYRTGRGLHDRDVTAMPVLDNSFVDALYGSAKTLVTVDPNLDVDDGPGWYKVFTSLTMLIALVFAASFTAGLVNRVVERRLTGLIGGRAVPPSRPRGRRRPRRGRDAAMSPAARLRRPLSSRSRETRRAATSVSPTSSACRS